MNWQILLSKWWASLLVSTFLSNLFLRKSESQSRYDILTTINLCFLSSFLQTQKGWIICQIDASSPSGSPTVNFLNNEEKFNDVKSIEKIARLIKEGNEYNAIAVHRERKMSRSAAFLTKVSFLFDEHERRRLRSDLFQRDQLLKSRPTLTFPSSISWSK